MMDWKEIQNAPRSIRWAFYAIFGMAGAGYVLFALFMAMMLTHACN